LKNNTKYNLFSAIALLALASFDQPAFAKDAKVEAATLTKQVGKNTLKLFPQAEERCYGHNFGPGKEMSYLFVSRSLSLPKGFERLGPSLEEAKASALKWGVSGTYGAGRVTVTAGFDNSATRLSQSLNCNDGKNGQVECRVECDGGGFNIKQRDGKMFFQFDKPGGQHLLLANGCGDESDPDYASREITPKLVEDNFELVSTEPEFCTEFEGYVRPKFAVLSLLSLSQRIVDQNFNCLSYSTDQKLLIKKPEESIDQVAISIKSHPKLSLDDDGFYSTHFDAALSLKRHDGSTAAENVICKAGDFEITCGKQFRLRRHDDTTATLVIGAWTGQADEDRKLAGLHIAKMDERVKLRLGQSSSCEVK
jgi:hypothetical protein